MKGGINMKNYFKLIVSVVMVSFLMISCQTDFENFENKVFVSSAKVGNLLVRAGDDAPKVVAINTSIAKPEDYAIEVTYKVDPALVAHYNEAYYTETFLLREEYYEISETVSSIMPGLVAGNDITITFTGLADLDRDSVYILPVTIADANIPVLESAKTTYYVVRAAAIINVAANLSQNFLSLNGAGTLRNLSEITMEALIRPDDFPNMLATVMGVEGGFLFRIGDAGIPPNQVQLATPSGNVTNAAWQVPTKVWTHLALTYNSANGAVELYMDGVRRGGVQTTSYRSAVNWLPTGTHPFLIGKAYDNERWLEGEASEYRVWNRVLTQAEINERNHFYDVDPQSPGLVAYWKFDEGAGIVVRDHTGNGNDVTADGTITWKEVSLP